VSLALEKLGGLIVFGAKISRAPPSGTLGVARRFPKHTFPARN
jgi:hypothetical protein